MDPLPPSSTIEALITTLHSQINTLESSLMPFVSPSPSSVQNPLHSPLAALSTQLPLLDRAKLCVLVTYTIESILFSYIKLHGEDARAHPVWKELARVKTYFQKIKGVEDGDGGSKRALIPDRAAVGRIVRFELAANTKLEAAKTASKLKPEAILADSAAASLEEEDDDENESELENTSQMDIDAEVEVTETAEPSTNEEKLRIETRQVLGEMKKRSRRRRADNEPSLKPKSAEEEEVEQAPKSKRKRKRAEAGATEEADAVAEQQQPKEKKRKKKKQDGEEAVEPPAPKQAKIAKAAKARKKAAPTEAKEASQEKASKRQKNEAKKEAKKEAAAAAKRKQSDAYQPSVGTRQAEDDAEDVGSGWSSGY